MKITRLQRAGIVTSGYTDRWLRYDTRTTVTIGDPVTTGYRCTFDDHRYAVRFVMDHRGIEWPEAYHMVMDSNFATVIPWEHRGTSSSTSHVHSVREILKVLSTGYDLHVRRKAAETPVSQEAFYALVWGLYQCNEKNALLRRWGLRTGCEVFVKPRGFDLDAEYDADQLRENLRILAESPRVCYS